MQVGTWNSSCGTQIYFYTWRYHTKKRISLQFDNISCIGKWKLNCNSKTLSLSLPTELIDLVETVLNRLYTFTGLIDLEKYIFRVNIPIYRESSGRITRKILIFRDIFLVDLKFYCLFLCKFVCHPHKWLQTWRFLRKCNSCIHNFQCWHSDAFQSSSHCISLHSWFTLIELL